MMTRMPAWETLLAVVYLECMPPRPKALFSGWMYSERSRPGATSRISSAAGSSGWVVKMPSIFESRMSVSACIICAIRPESSSLSVNISSVTETVSFSLTMGRTLFSSITVIHACWLRYCSPGSKFSFMVSTCPTWIPNSRNRS